MSCKREVSSGQSFFPTPFPVICGKTSAEPEQSRAAVEGWKIPASAQPGRTERGEWPCTTNKEEGRVGERKGGREGRGGGGKAIRV